MTYISHTLDLSHLQNLKPHDYKSKDSNDNSKVDAFVEELDSNWHDLIAYDSNSN